MKNFEDLLATAKLSNLLQKKEDDHSKTVLWILAIVGAIAVVASVAAIVYKYLSPDYLDDIDDDFEDDFFEDLDDEEEDNPSKEEDETIDSESPEASA